MNLSLSHRGVLINFLIRIKLIKCTFDVLFRRSIHYFLQEFWIREDFITRLCFLENDDGKVDSPPFSLVASLVFIHSKMNLSDLADLSKELLDKAFFNRLQEMTKINRSLRRKVDKGVSFILLIFDVSLVIVEHCLLTIYGDLKDSVLLSLSLIRHFR